MSLKPVAVKGDASAETGQGLVAGASKGLWSIVGDVTETSYMQLTSGGTEVIYQAECSFSFTGDSAPPQTTGDVIGASTVTLTASGTVAQGGLSAVLRDGDEVSDEYGNTVRISASAPLQSD